jgi:MEDS: MEthanogen/methylotroph, DcmR Sensory domain
MLGMLSDSVHAALTDGYSGLWATGDMTWELGSRKNFEKLLEYEIGLEEMFRSYPALSGICQYPNTTLRILNSNAPERSGCARGIWCAVPWSLHDPSWTGLARSVFYRAGPASSVHAPAASKTPQTATVYSIEHRR